MSNERIERGDVVRVDFNGAQGTLSSRADVMYVPVSTGDSWIFRDQLTSEIHYVSEGCTITLLQKKEATP
jgi:hypothetical protein